MGRRADRSPPPPHDSPLEGRPLTCHLEPPLRVHTARGSPARGGASAAARRRKLAHLASRASHAADGGARAEPASLSRPAESLEGGAPPGGEAAVDSLRFLPKLSGTRPEELMHLVMAPVPVDETLSAGEAPTFPCLELETSLKAIEPHPVLLEARRKLLHAEVLSLSETLASALPEMPPVPRMMEPPGRTMAQILAAELLLAPPDVEEPPPQPAVEAAGEADEAEGEEEQRGGEEERGEGEEGEGEEEGGEEEEEEEGGEAGGGEAEGGEAEGGEAEEEADASVHACVEEDGRRAMSVSVASAERKEIAPPESLSRWAFVRGKYQWVGWREEALLGEEAADAAEVRKDGTTDGRERGAERAPGESGVGEMAEGATGERRGEGAPGAPPLARRGDGSESRGAAGADRVETAGASGGEAVAEWSLYDVVIAAQHRMLMEEEARRKADELRKEAATSPFVLMQVPEPPPESPPKKFGLRWKMLGLRKPERGVELRNAALTTALLDALVEQVDFSQEQWNSFGIEELPEDAYVEVANVYFNPVKPERKKRPPPRKDKVRGVPSMRIAAAPWHERQSRSPPPAEAPLGAAAAPAEAEGEEAAPSHASLVLPAEGEGEECAAGADEAEGRAAPASEAPSDGEEGGIICLQEGGGASALGDALHQAEVRRDNLEMLEHVWRALNTPIDHVEAMAQKHAERAVKERLPAVVEAWVGVAHLIVERETVLVALEEAIKSYAHPYLSKQTPPRRDPIDFQLKFEEHVMDLEEEVNEMADELEQALSRVEAFGDEVRLGAQLYRVKAQTDLQHLLKEAKQAGGKREAALRASKLFYVSKGIHRSPRSARGSRAAAIAPRLARAPKGPFTVRVPARSMPSSPRDAS